MLTLRQVGNVAKTRYVNETGQLSMFHTFALTVNGEELRSRLVLRPVRGPKGKGKGIGGRANINFALSEAEDGKTLQSLLNSTLMGGTEAQEESNTIVFNYKYDEEVSGQGIRGWLNKLRTSIFP